MDNYINNICNQLIEVINTFSDHIFYIGQTDDLQRRLKEHYKDKRSVQIIGLYQNNKSVIEYIEQYLINTFYTNFNCMNKMVSTTFEKTNVNNINIDNNMNNKKNKLYPTLNNVFNTQWVYILFKSYVNITNSKYQNCNINANNCYCIDIISNKICITPIIEYMNKNNNMIKFNNKNNNMNINNHINIILNEIIKSDNNTIEQLKSLLIKINPYILQHININSQFSFILSNDFNTDKLKLIQNKNILEKNIKCIKRGPKEELKQIGKILSKFYKNINYNTIKYNNKLHFYNYWKLKYNNIIIYFYG